MSNYLFAAGSNDAIDTIYHFLKDAKHPEELRKHCLGNNKSVLCLSQKRFLTMVPIFFSKGGLLTLIPDRLLSVQKVLLCGKKITKKDWLKNRTHFKAVIFMHHGKILTSMYQMTSFRCFQFCIFLKRTFQFSQIHCTFCPE